MSNSLQIESLSKTSCRTIQRQPAPKFPKLQLGWVCVFCHRDMSCLACRLFLFSCINELRADCKMNWRERKKKKKKKEFIQPLSFLSHHLLPVDGTSVSLFTCPPCTKSHRGEKILKTLDLIQAHVLVGKTKRKERWARSSGYETFLFTICKVSFRDSTEAVTSVILLCLTISVIFARNLFSVFRLSSGRFLFIFERVSNSLEVLSRLQPSPLQTKQQISRLCNLFALLSPSVVY